MSWILKELFDIGTTEDSTSKEEISNIIKMIHNIIELEETF